MSYCACMSIRPEDLESIEEAKQQQHVTHRPTVAALEELLFEPIPLLDHGFVRVIDYMGDDTAVVQAARVSYGKGTSRVRDDRGLIRYLMRHRHTTPFEMCEIKFHVKLPIFVARQWIRHRTANVNEYSARYSVLDREFYIPMPEHLGVQSASNRQGRGQAIPAHQAEIILQQLQEDAHRCYDHYAQFLQEPGSTPPPDPSWLPLSRELARMNLTLNSYTQWYWKANLHNLLHFLALRMDEHAQHEIRVYADAMAHVVQKWMPFVYEAFVDYRLQGAEFSRQELQALQHMLQGKPVDFAALGLSKREQEEFSNKIKPADQDLL